ncbi:hypothetical protein M0R45_037501 [Rubus argutus]|uniref:Uncharacterized protein n=1 Tax=Rubus argutus TaxID=59490 RepID=A0AAW1W2F4_RUBAR
MSSHCSAKPSRFQRYITSPKKRKDKVVEKKVHVESLTLWLDRVVGIDPPKSQHPAQVGTGLPSLVHVPLEGHPLGEGFLNVEVLRYNSKENLSNPGTSNCPSIGAVSRARIPLPVMINERINGRYELVKCDESGHLKPEGYIILAMGLKGFTYY